MKIFSLILATVMVSPIALGATDQQAVDTKFQTLDSNKDSSLDAIEASRAGIGRELFSRYDANRDGKLDKAEFQDFATTGQEQEQEEAE